MMQVPGGNSRFAVCGNGVGRGMKRRRIVDLPVTLRTEGFNRQAARERELADIQLEPERRRELINSRPLRLAGVTEQNGGSGRYQNSHGQVEP